MRTRKTLTGTESVSNRLKVLQINLHHCRMAALNLQAVILRMGVDAALVQEPWQYRWRGLDIPGFKTLYPKSETKVRTCVVLRDNLIYTFLSGLSNPDLTVAGIERSGSGDGSGLILSAAYLPYDSLEEPPGANVANLTQYCAVQQLNLVLGA